MKVGDSIVGVLDTRITDTGASLRLVGRVVDRDEAGGRVQVSTQFGWMVWLPEGAVAYE